MLPTLQAIRLWTVTSLVLMLTGCVASETPQPVTSLLLPNAPSTFGLSVTVPTPKQGQDVRAFAAKERAVILEANQRLRNDSAFYGDVLDRFSSGRSK